MSEEPFVESCENCGSEIDEEQYNRTGVTDFCEECSDDPRAEAFGEDYA